MRLITRNKPKEQQTVKEIPKIRQKKPRKYNKPEKCNFSCDICGIGFELRSSIKIHFNLHLNKYEVCTKCDSKFTTKRTLNRHIQLFHEKIFKRKRKKCSDGDRVTINCYICDKLFESRFLCHLHESNHLQQQLICVICSKAFTSKKSLKLHKELHDGTGKRTCEICGVLLSNSDSLRSHIKAQHSNSSRFTCGVCLKSFKHRGSYNDHIAGHLDPRVKRCEVCGLNFNSRTACHAHKRRKHPNLKRICALPSINPTDLEQMKIVRLLKLKISPSGKNKGGKKSHLENIGNNRQQSEPGLSLESEDYYEDIEVLEEYAEEVKDLIQIKQPDTSLTKEKPNLKSSSPDLIKEPTVIQSKVKKPALISCSLCPQKFSDAVKHLNHKELHATNVLYCEICRIHFQRSSAKLQHYTKRHQNMNQFKCAHCPDKFLDKRTLLTHLEFKCSGFVTRPNLTNMRKSKTGQGKEGNIDWSCVNGAPPDGYTIRSWLSFNTKKKVTCETCGYITSTDYSAMEHSRKIHRIIPKQYSELWQRDNFSNTCPSCDKTFSQLSKFFIHQKCHNLEKFTCDICGCQLKGIKSFKKHQASHGPKTLHCPNCEQKFAHKERLAVHLKEKHSLVHQYSCQQCSRTFRYRSKYREHLQKHEKSRKM